MKQRGFSILMGLLTVAVIYGAVEAAFRMFDLPDPELVRDIETELLRGDGTRQGDAAPVYGWDENVIHCPADSSKLGVTHAGDVYTVLFVGDSVTRGFGLDSTREAYPILFCEMKRDSWPIHVINAAVQGYGVDQMLMKLYAMASKYEVDLIVFAYIPHDLWRPARNINYGLTKPVITFVDGQTYVKPAPPADHYFESYRVAKRNYHLSIWGSYHILRNRQYYLPRLHIRYFENLFHYIQGRLTDTAERFDADVLVVRLASTWPGDAVPYLDRLARKAFTAPTGTNRYRFYDSEACVRKKAVSRAIAYEEEFMYHPGPAGHEILAECILEELTSRPLKASPQSYSGRTDG